MTVERLQLPKDRAEWVLRTARRHGAGKVRVFGSVGRGTATGESDLDLLVEFEPGRDLFDLVSFKQELEEGLGRRVDVVTEASLSPHIRDAVLREAVSL